MLLHNVTESVTHLGAENKLHFNTGLFYIKTHGEASDLG